MAGRLPFEPAPVLNYLEKVKVLFKNKLVGNASRTVRASGVLSTKCKNGNTSFGLNRMKVVVNFRIWKSIFNLMAGLLRPTTASAHSDDV